MQNISFYKDTGTNIAIIYKRKNKKRHIVNHTPSFLSSIQPSSADNIRSYFTYSNPQPPWSHTAQRTVCAIEKSLACGIMSINSWSDATASLQYWSIFSHLKFNKEKHCTCQEPDISDKQNIIKRTPCLKWTRRRQTSQRGGLKKEKNDSRKERCVLKPNTKNNF
jgi:hypothetical protein